MSVTKIDYRSIMEFRIKNLKSVVEVLEKEPSRASSYWDAISRLDELECLLEYLDSESPNKTKTS